MAVFIHKERLFSIEIKIMESLKKINIKDLLPQQPPFVMVDKLKYFDDTKIITVFSVKSDNIFIENGFFTEPGIVENIAQTGAVRMGYINKYIQKDVVKLGFIGEIKNLIIEKLPRINEEIVTTIEVLNEVFSTLIVHAQVESGNEVIASGDMKITMTDITSVI